MAHSGREALSLSCRLLILFYSDSSQFLSHFLRVVVDVDCYRWSSKVILLLHLYGQESIFQKLLRLFC